MSSFFMCSSYCFSMEFCRRVAKLRSDVSMYALQKLARRLIFRKDRQLAKSVTPEQETKIHKFKESAWKFIYFLSAEIFALAVTYNEPWFTETKYFWKGPKDQAWPEQMCK